MGLAEELNNSSSQSSLADELNRTDSSLADELNNQPQDSIKAPGFIEGTKMTLAQSKENLFKQSQKFAYTLIPAFWQLTGGHLIDLYKKYKPLNEQTKALSKQDSKLGLQVAMEVQSQFMKDFVAPYTQLALWLPNTFTKTFLGLSFDKAIESGEVKDFLDPEFAPFTYLDKQGNFHPSVIRHQIQEEPLSTLLAISAGWKNTANGLISLGKKTNQHSLTRGGVIMKRITDFERWPEGLRRKQLSDLGEALAKEKGINLKELSPEKATQVKQQLSLDTVQGQALIGQHLAWKIQSMSDFINMQLIEKQHKSAGFFKQKLDKLTDQEKAQFGDIIMGTSPVPAKLRPQLMQALEQWKKLNPFEQKFLRDGMDRLSQNSIEYSKWNSVMVKRLGKELEVVDNPKQFKTNSNVLQLTPQQFEQLKTELLKEYKYVKNVKDLEPGNYLEPSYFPLYPNKEWLKEHKATLKAEVLAGTPLKGKPETGYLKQKLGSLYLQDKWEKNPNILIHHHNQVIKLAAYTDLAEQITKMSLTKPFNGTLLPNYQIFAPSHFLNLSHNSLLYTSKILERLDKHGDIRLAFQEALPDLIGKMKQDLGPVYQIPKSVGDALNPKIFGLIKDPFTKMAVGLYDDAIQYWKYGVLELRPKWYLNNVVGGVVMSVLAGSTPKDYLNALKKEKGSLVPADVIDYSSLNPLTNLQKEGFLPNVIRKGSEINKAVDSFFKRTVAIKQIESQARANLTKRYSKQVFSADEITKEALAIKKDPTQVGRVIKYVNDFLPNYRHLTPFEREIVVRAAPFWPFIRHQLQLDAKLLVKYPERGLLLKGLEDTARKMMPEEELAHYDKGEILIGRGEVTPYGPDGPKIPVKYYIPTAFWNPMVVGGSLQAGTPLLQNVVEYQSNKDLYTGQDIGKARFSSPIIAKIGDKEWMQYDTNLKDWRMLKHPISGPEYVLVKDVPIAGLLANMVSDSRKKQSLKAQKSISFYQQKDLPLRILSFLAYSQIIESPEIELRQELKELKTSVGKVKAVLIDTPQTRELLQKDPEALQKAVDFLIQQKNYLKMKQEPQSNLYKNPNLNEQYYAHGGPGSAWSPGGGGHYGPEFTGTEPFQNPYQERRYPA